MDKPVATGEGYNVYRPDHGRYYVLYVHEDFAGHFKTLAEAERMGKALASQDQW